MRQGQQLAHRPDVGGGIVLKQGQQQEQQPQPAYILRGHASQVNTLYFSSSGRLLYSGDADGHIAIWSLTTFRPLVFAKVHAASVLTVHEWENDKFLTHGRDNKIHVFRLPSTASTDAEVSSLTNLTVLKPTHTVEINALGYCKCAFVPLPGSQALVAVPAVLDDSLIDVIHLPSCKRVYRSIGKDALDSKTGTLMALAAYTTKTSLRVVASYEDGRVAMFEQVGSPADFAIGKADEGEAWTTVFEEKHHREPTMSIAVDSLRQQAWSVGADHLAARYDLGNQPASRAYKTAYPGRSAIAIRDDDRILAIAGWDGSVRIHSAKSFKPLAVLDYHRGSVYTVAFASVAQEGSSEALDKSILASDTQETRSIGRLPWLAAAGQDERISLWQMYPPAA